MRKPKISGSALRQEHVLPEFVAKNDIMRHKAKTEQKSHEEDCSLVYHVYFYSNRSLASHKNKRNNQASQSTAKMRLFVMQILYLGCIASAFRPSVARYTQSVKDQSFHRRNGPHLFAIDFNSQMDMDVVIYSKKDDLERKRIGALQEDGTLAPVSAWSDEPVYGTSLEFVVDEENRFPGLTEDDVIVHALIDPNSLAYGSRQVGGGKGPGNPHGEESELLYYVEKDKLIGVEYPINPHLEITW